MRYQLLQKINAEDNLALLFNAYLHQLHHMELMVMPRQTMAEHRQEFESATSPTPSQEALQVFQYLVPRFYHLQILSNSLTDLHRCVQGAIATLTTLFEQYEGDLRRYAIERRLTLLEEDGSDDESDWEPDGFDEEGQKWKVAYKDDEASLACYQFRTDLNEYFTGAESRGEKIGTSQVADYALFSDHVARATEFDLLKMLRSFTGAALPVYHQNEAGDIVAQTLADQVEDELNEDLRNQRLVATFNQVLDHLNHAAALQAFATTAEHHRELLNHLLTIRNVAISPLA